jgi:putative MATE family efflux protein
MKKSKAKCSQFDVMTKGPLTPLIVKLAIPTTISMLIGALYNLADTFFVSNLGTSQSGATGIVFTLITIIQAFGFMFGQGAGSNISRRLGARDVDSASRFASSSFFFALALGIVIGILGLVFLDPFMTALGSTATILPYSRIYGAYILIASPAFMTSFVLNNILRFEGRAAIAMTGMLTGAILNTVLDPILIYTAHMGIAGAGISTAISQYLSFAILLSLFLMGKTQSKISIRYISRNREDYANILVTGFPSLLRQGLNSVSSMLLNIQAAAFGDQAIAAMSIVSKCCMIIICISIGIGQGFQPVAGFNYGAGMYKRVREAYLATLKLAILAVGIFVLAGLIFSGNMISYFSKDPEVITVGTFALRAQLIAIFIAPVSMCSNMLFQSTGNSGLATVTAAFRSGICFIPLILILPGLIGVAGVQLAQPIADVISSVIVIPFVVHFFRKISAKKQS